MTPAISVFKFGARRIYVRGGVISDELTQRQYTSANRKNIRKIFITSCALTLALFFYTSGRSFAARASYYVREAWPTLAARVLSDEYETKKSPALLPLAANVEGSFTNLAAEGTSQSDEEPSGVLPSPATGLVNAAAPSIVHEKPAQPVAIPKSPRITIPGLRVSAPIVETSLDLKTINKDLEKGVIRWPESGELGGGKVTVLLGHSSAPLSYRGKYGAVFTLLDKLKPGDSITVDTSDGTLRYRVRDHFIIDPKNAKEDVLKSLDGEGIVLVSCWPVGTNWQRIAVRADRIP